MCLVDDSLKRLRSILSLPAAVFVVLLSAMPPYKHEIFYMHVGKSEYRRVPRDVFRLL